VTDYTATSTNRNADFQTAIYGTYQGRSMTPDVLLGQEFHDATAVSNFVALLNTAPNSPGDWTAAPFINGPDTDSTFFYRTSRVAYQTTTIVSAGSSTAGQPPRNTYRYDLQIVGAAANSSLLSCYSVHLKASDTDVDQATRLIETTRIRDNAQTLPAGRNFLVAGDFNIQSSSQSAYQELVGSQANNAGRFFDPINTPGNWNNNSAFRFVHTQDPAGAGGMDDRLDLILLDTSLGDGANLDYKGNPQIAYSATTWDDPNHSYRAWGNDGTSFNTTLNTTTNSMVGPDIASALKRSALSGGHLPVFLDLSYAVVPEPGTVVFALAGSLPLVAAAVRRRRCKRA